MTNKTYTSKHFTLEEIAIGTYAAIAKDGSGSVGNAGFVDLGDKTLVFDTFNTQQAAEDLKQIAEEITNQPVTWVINSHWHGDHIRGNQVFGDSQIIASEKTYQQMKLNHPARIKKQKDDIDGLYQYIQSLEEKLRQNKDESLMNQINFLKELALSLPSLELVLPKYTYNNSFTFYGSKRTAKLFTLGGGHSACDSLLFIPENKVLFMGDLLFVESHPTFFDDSNLNNWIEILKNVEEMNFEIAVPGHGPVGEKSELRTVINYINTMLSMSEENIAIENIQMPGDYKNWPSPEIFYQNLKRAIQQQI